MTKRSRPRDSHLPGDLPSLPYLIHYTISLSLKIFSSLRQLSTLCYSIGSACSACATRSRTYMKDASAPLKADACWIDDAFNPPTAHWTLNTWSDACRLRTQRQVLFQHPCTSALIPIFMTYQHLHKCNYPRTSFDLFYFSIILRAPSGQSLERFAARAPRRRAICRKRRALISMEGAMPNLSGARSLT